jgi:hypothetical protein
VGAQVVVGVGQGAGAGGAAELLDGQAPGGRREAEGAGDVGVRAGEHVPGAGHHDQRVDLGGVQPGAGQRVPPGAGAKGHGVLAVELVAGAERLLAQRLGQGAQHPAGADLGVAHDFQAPVQVRQARVAVGDRADHGLLGDRMVGPDQRRGADGGHVSGPPGCRPPRG